MFKLFFLACMMAVAAAKPGLVAPLAYTAPVAAAYSAPLAAYSTPLAYSAAYTAPVAYSAYSYASPYAAYYYR